MVPNEFPDERFDLIVLSEVLYYLTFEDLDVLAVRCMEALAPGGTVLTCHWLGETDCPLTGAQATERFLRQTVARQLSHARLVDGEYRLDRLDDVVAGGSAKNAGSSPLG